MIIDFHPPKIALYGLQQGRQHPGACYHRFRWKVLIYGEDSQADFYHGTRIRQQAPVTTGPATVFYSTSRHLKDLPFSKFRITDKCIPRIMSLFPRPLKKEKFYSRSRKGKILPTGIHEVLRGSKFEPGKEFGQKRVFFKGLGQTVVLWKQAQNMRGREKEIALGRNPLLLVC